MSSRGLDPQRWLLSAAVLLALGLAVWPMVGRDRPTAQLATPTPTPEPARDAAPTMAPLPTATATPGPRYAEIKPNELGKIMVLEYHVIGDEEERWTRTRVNFRKDLEYLYRNGYYLTPLQDILDNRIRVPSGKTPVVLTFDDSNRSQFQLVAAADGQLKVDPLSALGILEKFITEHPDFGRAAIFCLLPGADPPNDLFGEPKHRQQKLQYLVKQGYELCNHTLWHAILTDIDEQETMRQLALTSKAVQESVPGYQMQIFNPPQGVYPKDLKPLLEGSFEGISYRHRAILEVTGGPLTAPNDQQTDFLHIPRIQAIPDQLEMWFGHFEQRRGERYVSDGDPDRVVFPAELAGRLKPASDLKEETTPDPAYTVLRLR
jgi:hypothetical protein